MVLRPFQTDGLGGICSKDQLDLMNSIDSLRSQGINHYVSLPQIIVCGDQSSGKSSVLEAISGVSFPIKGNLCTRFPTELVLRKSARSGVSVSIVPHQSRSEAEQQALSSFHATLDGFEGLPALIEEAKSAMGITPHGKAFSKDLLRVEVSGPDRPHLTIVDLPGLIHSETKQQSASDIELVQSLVKSYMVERRSIILAVVSAKNDIANQIVLKLSRNADERGIRTLGVITKPDTLVPGSEAESGFVSLAKNQEVELRHGWHVLKNMDSDAGTSSLETRDAEEELFFSRGAWQDLSRSLVGVGALRDRLSKVLLQQIATELPSLIDEIDLKISACTIRLEKLGKPRATILEQRLHLVDIGEAFQSLVKAAVDGTYNNSFFGDARTELGYQKRIRAVVQNLNQEFADLIGKRGHCHQIVDSKAQERTVEGVLPITISRENFLRRIQYLMERTRGRELPGMFNPMIVEDLFVEQSAPWKDIAQNHVDKVWKAAKDFLVIATSHIADEATSKALLQKVFEPALDELHVALKQKTHELLAPHQKGHPITYNHYFTDTLQQIRSQRNKDEFSQTLMIFFRTSSLRRVQVNEVIDLESLLSKLILPKEPDMNRFACMEALDCMEAYYKVFD